MYMKRVPATITINLKTGTSSAEYVEISDEQYNKLIVESLAKILYKQMINDIESGKFNPKEYNRK